MPGHEEGAGSRDVGSVIFAAVQELMAGTVSAFASKFPNWQDDQRSVHAAATDVWDTRHGRLRREIWDGSDTAF